MHRIILLFFLVSFNQKESLSQTFRATYDCIYFSGGKDSENNQMGFDVTMKIRYTVYANEKYVEVNGELIDATKFGEADVGYSGKDDKAIIDIKQQIIYFPEGQIYKKVRAYKIDFSNRTDLNNDEYHLINTDTSIKVSYSEKRGFFITPGLLLLKEGHTVAVKSIKTPMMIISLVECDKDLKKELDYSEIFKNASERVGGNFDFFQ